MGDESLGGMDVHMAYHARCNCFPSSQRLKGWYSGIVRDYNDSYHKSAKRILGSVTAVIVGMSKFDLRMFLVYKLWEQSTANLYFMNIKIFIYYFSNLIKIKESHRFVTLNWIDSKYKMKSCD